MACRQLQEDFQAYLDGELSPVRRASIESHLTACSDCRQVIAELEAVSGALHKWSDRQPTGGFEMSLHSRMAVEASSKPAKTAASPAPSARAGSLPPARTVSPARFLRWITRGWRPVALAAAVLLSVIAYVARDTAWPGRRIAPGARPQLSGVLANAATSAQVADTWVWTCALGKRAIASRTLEVSRVVSSDIVSGFLASVESDSDRSAGLKLITLVAKGPQLRQESRPLDTASVWIFPFRLLGREVYAAQAYADPLARARQLELEGRLAEALSMYQEQAKGPLASRASLAQGAVRLRMGDIDAAQTALNAACAGDDSVVRLAAQELLAEIAAARPARQESDRLRLNAVSTDDWLKVGLLEVQGCDYRSAANSFMKAASVAGGQSDAADEARFRSAWCHKEMGQISTGVYGFKALFDQPRCSARLAYAAGIEQAIGLARIGRFPDSVTVSREVARRPAPDASLEAFLYFQKGCVELRNLKDGNAAAESLGRVSAAGQGNLSYAAYLLLQSGAK